MGWFRRGGNSPRFKGRNQMEAHAQPDPGNQGMVILRVTACHPGEQLILMVVDAAGRPLSQEMRMAADADGELKVALPRPPMPGCVARVRSVVRGEFATAPLA